MHATPQPPAPSSRDYEGRTRALRTLLDDGDLDGVLTFASTMRPGALVYQAGYAPTNGYACLYLTADSEELLTDQPWDVAAARDELWLDADCIQPAGDFSSELATRAAGARRIGVIGWELLPAAVADGLRASSPDLELVDIGTEAARLRMVKSDEEIGLIREACRITSEGAAALALGAEAGASERELAAEIESAMRRAGSGPLAFPLILGAGAAQTSSAVPLPGARVLATGDMVLLDCGATYRGYCGDMARTHVVGGHPSAAQLRMLVGALAIFEACNAELQPGKAVCEIHATATALARSLGFDLPFLLGHGIGCQNWEAPLLSETDDTELETGMVITLEPGLYRPDVGGVRLENTFLITENGPESLTVGPIEVWER